MSGAFGTFPAAVLETATSGSTISGFPTLMTSVAGALVFVPLLSVKAKLSGPL